MLLGWVVQNLSDATRTGADWQEGKIPAPEVTAAPFHAGFTSGAFSV